MFARTKDFDSRFLAANLSDWRFDDWGDPASALHQSILDLFAPGGDPEADLETQVIPGLLQALRQYVADGVSLGYTPDSSQDSYAMMSASGGGESKSGYLNASDHASIKESSAAIMRHAKIIQSASANVERANARARAGQLQGFPLYSQHSAPSYFEQKEAEADLETSLKLLNTRLEVESVAREAQQSLLESAPSPTAGVERALAALIERNSARNTRASVSVSEDELTTRDRLRIEKMSR